MIGMVLALALFAQSTPAAPGTLSGQLLTLEGAPAVSFRVAAVIAPAATVLPSFGQQYYLTDAPVTTALTDNQGRYRLVNLPPGRYFIMSGTTYFPTTLDADHATVVTLNPGTSIGNLNFKLLTAYGGSVGGTIKPRPAPGVKETATLSGVNFEGLLEVPIDSDGRFEFGHIPTGDYLIDINPTPPGLPAFRFKVDVGDVNNVEIVRPPTHRAVGRIVVQNGPLPRAYLAFTAPQSYVGGTINPDGTFDTPLQSARHKVELAGMPGGYSIASVRVGSQDVTANGFAVADADVRDVLVTVAAPSRLPHLRGRVTGLAASRMANVKVELTGLIVGKLEVPLKADGSFEFPALVPSNYDLRLTDVPELKPVPIVVSWDDSEVSVAVPGR